VHTNHKKTIFNVSRDKGNECTRLYDKDAVVVESQNLL